METKPHKWAAVIHAWADGRAVQWRTGVEWYGYTTTGSGEGFNAKHVEWRIKPEVVRYRVALFRTDDNFFYTLTTSETFYDKGVEGRKSFVRWLGDWQEVEI